MIRNIVFLALLLYSVSSVLARQLVVSRTGYVNVPCKSTELAEANRKFSIDLFQKLARDNPDQNVLLSPIVIGMGLSMILEGARGATRKELEQILHYNGFLNEETSCIYKKYNHPVLPEMTVAAKLFGEKSEGFTDDFIIQTSKFAENKMELVDFANQPEFARKTMNDWVEGMTNGRITDMFPSGSIETQTKLALATTLYFKGIWVTPFEDTYTANFTLTAKSVQTNVEFMYQRIETRSIVKMGLDFLELPYVSEKGGPQMSMILVLNRLPNYDISSVEERLTDTFVNEAINELFKAKYRDVIITLPKFELKQDYDLVKSLEDMGLNHLFQGGETDLSGMNGGRDLFVSSAKHKTFLSVNEGGTEAAAAASFGITRLSLPKQLLFTKPFHLLLWEQHTRNIMFMGRVFNPKA